MATAATRSHDYLVSPAEGIEGSKLPSGKQVFSYFLHCHNVLHEDVRTAAKHVIERVEEFWSRANIPTKHRQDSIKKLEQLFADWKSIKKNKSRHSKTQHAKESEFLTTIEELFDIAHANAVELISHTEDKLFMESQRQKGRPGCMSGVDKVLLLQQQKQKEKEETLQRRKHRSELDKSVLLEKALFESSTESDSDDIQSETEDSDPVPSTSTEPPPRKRGRCSVMSSQLAAMLDRNLLSDRAAMMIMFETSRALGQDPEALALNRSTIRRLRQKHREATAAGIMESFKPTTTLTVHWDGKLMSDLTGKDKVDRLPILVSTMGEKKLLDIPKIPAGTGHAVAHAVYGAIQEWELEYLVRAMCFDTTSSNTGRLSGACVILEQKLGRPLLHLGCRHHVLELILAAAFGACMGPSKAPEILLFKRFQGQWTSFDKKGYIDASSDEYVSSQLADTKDEIIVFCEQQLHIQQPRDDYREFLQLVLIFLGRKEPHDVTFRAPGPMHQARWIAKAIYSLKIWMFRSQFQLTARECRGLSDLNIFITKIYIKFWFLAPVAPKAAWNDLQLLQQLHSFPHRDISEATSRKLAGQLWYLSEDLILFALFDQDVDINTKRAIVKASMEKEGTTKSLKRAEVQLSSVKQKMLVDFVSKSSRTVFATLGVPDGFLLVDPELWGTRDDYKAAAAIVNTLSVTNDHAERGVALIQDAVRSGCFKNEIQLQYALQVIEKNRAEFPDAKKSTLLQKPN